MTRTAAEVIAAYRPSSLAPGAAAYARRVAATAPGAPSRAKALLFAAGTLASFALRVGLPLDETLLATAVIERFVASGAVSEPATRRTLRTNLRALRRALEVAPGTAALSRERAKAPYSPSEIASYLALCDAQPTVLRRQRASALVCLGAGAGLVGGELRGVGGSDVVCRSGGVLVVVCLLPDGVSNRDLREHLAPLLGIDPASMTAGGMTYDLRRMRLHGLVERVPHTHRYRVTPFGLRVAMFFTRTYARLLRQGLVHTFEPNAVPTPLRRRFDQLDDAINALVSGSAFAA